jgi:hypothetical protein
MATTQLNRTLAASDLDKWTFSTWVKKSGVTGYQHLIAAVNGSAYTVIKFETGGQISFENYDSGGSNAGQLKTNALFRDPGAWYHIVAVWDSDNGSAGDRMKIYVNGVEETSFAADVNPASDQDSTINSAVVHYIGARDGSDYLNGVLAHTHFCDGQAYAATDFGETDATSGIWIAKSGPSVTYGTNGFFLKYASGAHGTDSSGESNDFVVSGTMTNTKDTPDNNFATLNPLDTSIGTLPTITNGNTTTTTPDSWAGSTIPIQSGKWYWEVKVPSAGVECVTGVLLANNLNYSGTDWLGVSIAGVYGFAGISGNKITSGTAASYDSAISTNDIMMFAMDATAGSLYVGVNGTWLQSSNPATSTSPMISSMGTSETWIPFATISSGGGTCINNFNFGNGYFGTTIVSSSEADDAGIGSFEYDVPAGYYALCTNNLGDQS